MKKLNKKKVFTQEELDEIIKKRLQREANKRFRVETENCVLKNKIDTIERELDKYKFIIFYEDIVSYKNTDDKICPFRIKRWSIAYKPDDFKKVFGYYIRKLYR